MSTPRTHPTLPPQVLMLFDVDFWPSVELSEVATNATKYEAVAQAVAEGHAIVVPAFETRVQNKALEATWRLVHGGKPVALEMLGNKSMIPFHVSVGFGCAPPRPCGWVGGGGWGGAGAGRVGVWWWV